MKKVKILLFAFAVLAFNGAYAQKTLQKSDTKQTIKTTEVSDEKEVQNVKAVNKGEAAATAADAKEEGLSKQEQAKKWARAQTLKLDEIVNLTDEQKETSFLKNLEYYKQYTELKAKYKAAGDKEGGMAALKDLKADRIAKMEGWLTPEQVVSFKEYKAAKVNDDVQDME